MKLRDLLNEYNTVKLSDLSIGSHGTKFGGMIRLTVPKPDGSGNTYTFPDNEYGQRDLEDWKKSIVKKYNVKTLTVKNGHVTIIDPKYKKDVQTNIAKKNDVTWGFE
jgi:hypothetical protein